MFRWFARLFGVGRASESASLPGGMVLIESADQLDGLLEQAKFSNFCKELLEVNRKCQINAVSGNFEETIEETREFANSEFFKLSHPKWSDKRPRSYLCTVFLELATAHLQAAQNAITDPDKYGNHTAKAWKLIGQIAHHGHFSFSEDDAAWTEKETADINENITLFIREAAKWSRGQSPRTMKAVAGIDEIEAEALQRLLNDCASAIDSSSADTLAHEVAKKFEQLKQASRLSHPLVTTGGALGSELKSIVDIHYDHWSRAKVLQYIWDMESEPGSVQSSLSQPYLFHHHEVDGLSQRTENFLADLVTAGFLAEMPNEETWSKPSTRRSDQVEPNSFLSEQYPSNLDRSLKFLLGISPSVARGDAILSKATEYNISGQGNVVLGEGSTAADVTTNVTVNGEIREEVDLDVLAEQLKELRIAMKKENEDSHVDADVDIGKIAAAEAAAREGDAETTASSLKGIGKWSIDVATKIGASLATAVLKDLVLPKS